MTESLVPVASIATEGKSHPKSRQERERSVDSLSVPILQPSDLCEKHRRRSYSSRAIDSGEINAGHTDGAVKKQTLPEALEYVWQGYKAK
jgi:hypothetical protein